MFNLLDYKQGEEIKQKLDSLEPIIKVIAVELVHVKAQLERIDTKLNKDCSVVTINKKGK